MVNNHLKLSGELSVKPGQNFCYDCFNACNSSQSSVHFEHSKQNRGDVDKSYHDVDVELDKINVGLVNSGSSPQNFRKLARKINLFMVSGK